MYLYNKKHLNYTINPLWIHWKSASRTSDTMRSNPTRACLDWWFFIRIAYRVSIKLSKTIIHLFISFPKLPQPNLQIHYFAIRFSVAGFERTLSCIQFPHFFFVATPWDYLVIYVCIAKPKAHISHITISLELRFCCVCVRCPRLFILDCPLAVLSHSALAKSDILCGESDHVTIINIDFFGYNLWADDIHCVRGVSFGLHKGKGVRWLLDNWWHQVGVGKFAHTFVLCGFCIGELATSCVWYEYN